MGRGTSGQSAWGREVEMVSCVAGIYFFYLLYGLAQEDLTRTAHPPDGERFTFTWFMVFVQCISNTLCAAVALHTYPQSQADAPPQTQYAVVSLCYIGAMFFSNASLNYVDYPTQVLAKSCKMIPVLFMGVLFAGNRYPMSKYLCVVMISAGISIFVLKDIPFLHLSGNIPPSAKAGQETSAMGLGLLAVSLLLDGATASMQDRLKKTHRPSGYHLMLFMNLYAIAYTFLGLIVTGQLHDGVAFCIKHPHALWDLVKFSVASALGQNFIFHLIYRFGALACSTVTTTRKFFTILASVIYYGHEVNVYQWCGISLVFCGLLYDTYSSYRRSSADAKATAAKAGKKEQ